METLTMFEILDAFHLTKNLVNSPFPQRGGMMLVAPPSALKSTMISKTLEDYPNALVLTDLNINTLVKLKGDLTSNRYSTLAFGEFEKLYQRHTSTSSNIEGSIKALVEEGFSRASFEDVRMGGLVARTCVIGGLTPDFHDKMYNGWLTSGFSRRFLWVLYGVSNPENLDESIHEWKLLDLADGFERKYPGLKGIPFNITDTESRYLRTIINDQPGRTTPYVILKKLMSVLKWKHPKNNGRAMEIMRDFAPSLSKNGGMLNLPCRTV